MKKFLVAIAAFVSFSSVSFAQQFDAETEQLIESIALSQVQDADAVNPHSFLGLELSNPLDLIKKVQEQIQSIKDTMIASYDANGNGKIDAGDEFNTMVEGLKALALILTDSNQNGKFDSEDAAALAKTALEQAKAQVHEKICPKAVEEAKAAGFWLNFRPVLKSIYNFCTTDGQEAK